MTSPCQIEPRADSRSAHVPGSAHSPGSIVRRCWRALVTRPRRLPVLLLVGTLAVLAAGFSVGGEDKQELSEKEMKRLLRQSILGGDEASLRETLKRMGRIQGREPARAVLDIARALSPTDEKYYWFLLEGVATFRAPLAFSELGDFILQYKKTAIARDLLHALQKSTHKYVNRVVRRVLDRGPIDLQLMAVDLAARLPYRRTVDILMPIYEQLDGKDDGASQELKMRVVYALEALTRENFGDSLPNWQGFWAGSRSKGLKIIRQEAEGREHHTGLAQPLDPIRQRQFLALEELAGKILVIKGCTARNGVDTNFDHMEAVLERIGMKPDVWEKTRLEDKDCPPLERYAAVFINCTQINEFCQSPGHTAGEFTGNRLHRCMGPAPHDNFQGKMKDAALKRIKAYVEGGGHLFTEDWALVEVIEMIFGEYLGAGDKLSDSVVDIRAARGNTSHPLLRGVFVPPVKLDDFDWDQVDDDEDDEPKEGESYDPSVEDDEGDSDESGGMTGVGGDPASPPADLEELEIEQIKHKWKIDNESPAIDVRSKKVTVLISSDDLKAASGDAAVAVTFPVKRGVVLHVLSHFGKQHSRKDEATLENLMVNFLIEVHLRVKRR